MRQAEVLPYSIRMLRNRGVLSNVDGDEDFRRKWNIHTERRASSLPKNAWHGFANPDYELLLLWIVAPPGLDGFFRETCNPPGLPTKQLAREQVNQIARKYGTEYR